MEAIIFLPDPRDIIHFDVIFPLLQEIHQWTELLNYWIRMISGTYPVTSYLYGIKKEKSPNCTFCDRGDGETKSHFLKVCPKFRNARTAVNTLRKSSADWKLADEAPMFLTGLYLKEVPTSTVLVRQAGRSVQDSQIQAGQMSLGRWQLT